MLKVVFLLLAAQVLRITDGAPTLGEELVENFQKNMDSVHGNLMAGMTNIIQPLADLLDRLPEALLGKFDENGMVAKGKDELDDLILGSASALNSGIKLGSTIITSPFKLAGDGMMAMENIAMGRKLDTSEALSEHRINKRGLRNQRAAEQKMSKEKRELRKQRAAEQKMSERELKNANDLDKLIGMAMDKFMSRSLQFKNSQPQARVFNGVSDLANKMDDLFRGDMTKITQLFNILVEFAKNL